MEALEVHLVAIGFVAFASVLSFALGRMYASTLRSINLRLAGSMLMAGYVHILHSSIYWSLAAGAGVLCGLCAQDWLQSRAGRIDE